MLNVLIGDATGTMELGSIFSLCSAGVATSAAHTGPHEPLAFCFSQHLCCLELYVSYGYRINRERRPPYERSTTGTLSGPAGGLSPPAGTRYAMPIVYSLPPLKHTFHMPYHDTPTVLLPVWLALRLEASTMRRAMPSMRVINNQGAYSLNHGI
jgi:hypothetical protein